MVATRSACAEADVPRSSQAICSLVLAKLKLQIQIFVGVETGLDDDHDDANESRLGGFPLGCASVRGAGRGVRGAARFFFGACSVSARAVGDSAGPRLDLRDGGAPGAI